MIGLLDIFGFENFKENSFEQLCINFTNEKLQQLYVSYIFKQEQVEYKRDGLEELIKEIKYDDNQSIIELIEKKPMGILLLLDEETNLQKGSDQVFVS